MGYKYTGEALLKTPFEVISTLPLDNRTVVNSKQDLYDIPDNSAYAGMTIANLEDGNIYMLRDIDNITNGSGWKASGIDIITCTYSDYQKWSENTKEDFTPKNPKEECLNPDSYYYVIEDDSLKGRYLTQSWGDNIVSILNTKVDNSAILNVRAEVTDLSNLIKNEYSKTLDIEKAYAKLSDVYNKQEIDDIVKPVVDGVKANKDDIASIKGSLENFVKKDQLGEDFNFVTSTEFDTFKTSIGTNFESETITTSNLVIQKSEEQSTGLSMGDEGLLLDGQKIALSTEVPKILCVTEDYYNNLKTKEDDIYYFTYRENFDNGYIDKEYLEGNYYNKPEVDLAIQKKIVELQKDVIEDLLNRIAVLESYHKEDSFELDTDILDETELS